MEAKRQQEKERNEQESDEARQQEQQARAAASNESDDEEETDDETDDEDDYGPSPAAGIWAGSQKLLKETAKIEDEAGDETNGKESENKNEGPPSKKTRVE